MPTSTKIRQGTTRTGLLQARSLPSSSALTRCLVSLLLAANGGCSGVDASATSVPTDGGIDGVQDGDRLDSSNDVLPDGADADEGADAIGAPVDALDTADSVVGDALVDVASDGVDSCPIVNGACSDGCVPSRGSRYDATNDCLGEPDLLACYDQFETPPAQALPMRAPDQSCWLVYPAAYKLDELGWVRVNQGDPFCDPTAIMTAPYCGQ